MTKRIIPCLDTTLDEQGKAVVVKGIEFENLKYAGDPVELAMRYDVQGADELVFLDISASYEGRGTMVSVVEKIAKQVSIPVIASGGAGNVEHMYEAFMNGANACLAASIFHYRTYTVGEIKDYLRGKGFL